MANDLIRFYVRSGTPNRPGPVLLDDIYLATGKNLTDPVGSTVAPLQIVVVTPDLASGDLTLRWEVGGPMFQVEKAAAITDSFLPVGPAQSERMFTDPGAVTIRTQSFYRVRQVGEESAP